MADGTSFLDKDGLFLIAEIGGNHEGDFDYACRLTELAIKSGADAVKFQLYKGDTLVSEVESPVRNKHFKKFELSKDQDIDLRIYDVNGRLVREYVRSLSIGVHHINWDGAHINGDEVPAEAYLYELSAGSQRAVGRMVLVK